MSLTQKLTHLPSSLRLRTRRLAVNARIWHLTRQVLEHRRLKEQPAVVFFNASTRLAGISQNAAFSLLASLGLQLAGVPVVHFACHAGMSRCVLSAAYLDPAQAPPCRRCIAQTRPLLLNGPTLDFGYEPLPSLAAALLSLGVDEMAELSWQTDDLSISLPAAGNQNATIPLGPLTLPALRWVLRRHHLDDDRPTRTLFREFILSAANVARHFDALLAQVQPQAVVVFNGQFFPEATARWLAQARGIRVISHEVGLRPFTAFFTEGEATAYPLDIPADFELDETQNTRLDEYLSQRFQGQFSMAGVRFWPGMSRLDEGFLAGAAQFKQIVPVFTNVIFDTSQPHSNVVFPHMFAWLDLVLQLAHQHPETLFVLRAHPDETRPGKESRESVAQWVEASRATDLPNVVFIDSHQTLSSYELIQRSKFVMIYNSTIGLEASILGAAVLCGGRARFTQLPTVFFPQTIPDYRRQAETLLSAESIDIPPAFRHNARRFLYVQLFQSSLPFGDFLEEDSVWPGFVRLKAFPWERLKPENAPAIQVLVDGLLHGGNFLLKA